MSKQLLQTLTPAEVQTLLKPETNNLHELLKLTFLDLVRKKLLRITERKDAIGTESYISAGQAFYTAPAMAHEEVLLKMFRQSANLEVQIKKYLKAVKSSVAHQADSYRKKILAGERLRPFIKQSFFYRIFNIVLLNEDGVLMQHKLHKILQEENNKLIHYQRNHQEAGLKKLLQELGGMVFLLPAFSDSLCVLLTGAAVWETTQKQLHKPVTENGSGGCSGGGCGSTTWGAAFDSGCHNHDAGGGSGGHGSGCDSGCSGCGGCGGGGCGGGCS